ncbi:hypothetical protein SK128_002513 [Halocaridina rubra]|uniref:Uncharacterized protein n=1 Tax=Halocaridina rubra TaxID=373956 RepID=A0AAN9AHH2_HALRR
MLSSRAAAFSVKALLDPNPDKGKVLDTHNHQAFGTLGATGKSLWRKKGRTKNKLNGGGERPVFSRGYNGFTDSTMEWDPQMEEVEEEEEEAIPDGRMLSFHNQGLDNRLFNDNHNTIFDEDEELVDVENCIENTSHASLLPLGVTHLGLNSPPSSPMATHRIREERNYLSKRYPSASSSANSDWQMYVHTTDESLEREEAGIGGAGSRVCEKAIGRGALNDLSCDSRGGFGSEEVRIELLHADLWTKFNDLQNRNDYH